MQERLGGFMLALIGYQSSTTGGAIQSVLVQEKMFKMVKLVTSILLICIRNHFASRLPTESFKNCIYW